jgi:hypothetical protein
MFYADLSPAILISLVGVAFTVLVTRAAVFFYRERNGFQPVYPNGWSAAQCRALERFRLAVGVVLIPLWGFFLFIAPSVHTNWPTGYKLDVTFFIFLLFINNAWILLLLPRNWRKFGAISRSFWITFIFLVIWWAVTFTATGWMLLAAWTSPPITPSIRWAVA